MSRRVLVMLCANGRDRELLRRSTAVAGTFADFDTVHYLVIATAERAIRGLTFDFWGATEQAIDYLGAHPAVSAAIHAAFDPRVAVTRQDEGA